MDRDYFLPEARMHAAMCNVTHIPCEGCGNMVEVGYDDYRCCWTIGDEEWCTCEQGLASYRKGISPWPEEETMRPCYLVDREEVLAEMLGEMDRVLGR